MSLTIRIPVLFLVLCGFATGANGAAPSEPQICSPPTGAPSGIPGGRDPLWSQPPDVNGYKVSSEIISDYSFESELADDFVLSYVGHFTGVTFWGGYFNWSQGDPEISSLNIRIYEDQEAAPGWLLAEFLDRPVEATFVGYDGSGYPTYRYTAVIESFWGVPFVRYWIVFQAGDHPFPPQWGRQQALTQVDNPAMFRCAYLGYETWTPVSDIGDLFDGSFEVECAVVPGMSGACCLPDGHCTYADAVHCVDFMHGLWRPCMTCEMADCPDAEACCFPDGNCESLAAFACRALGGQPQGTGTACDPNPCEATPVQATSWGQLRGVYR